MLVVPLNEGVPHFFSLAKKAVAFFKISRSMRSFLGEMNIGAGRHITINNDWQLASFFDLNLNGGTTTATEAELRGSPLAVAGNVNVDKRAALDVPNRIV